MYDGQVVLNDSPSEPLGPSGSSVTEVVVDYGTITRFSLETFLYLVVNLRVRSSLCIVGMIVE